MDRPDWFGPATDRLKEVGLDDAAEWMGEMSRIYLAIESLAPEFRRMAALMRRGLYVGIDDRNRYSLIIEALACSKDSLSVLGRLEDCVELKESRGGDLASHFDGFDPIV